MTTQRTWPVRAETRRRNREALLTAAGELLVVGDYASCSLTSIAARAGLTTGAVYSIFGSKAELFLELLRDQSELPTFDELTAGQPDLASALVAYGEHWAALANDPDRRRLSQLSYEIQLAALREPTLQATIIELHVAERAELAAQFEAAATRRKASLSVPASELAASVMAALQGLTQTAVLAGQPADGAMFGAVARRLLGP
jgi:AcrR family transcriptional regulator